MLIKNVRYLITQNRKRDIVENVDILIENGKITAIGNNLEKTGEVFDASNKLVLPGLINSHTHLPMSLFRGVSDKNDLHTWLTEEIAPLESKLSEDIAYYGDMLSILEGITTGTTTFCDMYSFNNAVIRAVTESDVRAFVCSGIRDKNDKTKIEEEIARAKNITDTVKKCGGNINPILALHWTLSCSDELILRLVDMNKEKLPIHMHVAETSSEVKKNIELYGKRPFERLHELGALGENFVAVHAVHINDQDIEHIVKSGSKIVYNPTANMKLADGVCPVNKLMKNNVCVALGTDSPASNDNLNMFEEMKIAALLQKVSHGAAAINAQQALDMTTVNAAGVLGAEADIGSVEVGKFADLIFIDKNEITMNPLLGKRNIVPNLVYSFTGNVSDVMVNGKFLLKNFVPLTLDKSRILDKVNELTPI